MIVSLALVIYGFSYDRCVVLALVTVMGNLISQLSLNYNRPHMEDSRRPLIYWDAILLLAPAQLGGSAVGKMIAKLLPDTVKKAIALLVLVLVTVKTSRKGLALYRKESKEIEQPNTIVQDAVKDSGTRTDVENRVVPINGSTQKVEDLRNAVAAEEDGNVNESESVRKEDQGLDYPWPVIGALTALPTG